MNFKLKIVFLILFFSTFLINFSVSFASEKITIPEEEMEMLKDYGSALKKTINETKGELENIQTKYTWVKDHFGNHKYPKILKLINTLDKGGLGKHLKNGINTLGRYESGLKKVSNVVTNVESILTFYSKYKPDKNNPIRSLEQISSALEELNTRIKKFDPSGGILTKPITAIIDYYQQSASAFSGALSRVRKNIKERGGGGIGIGFPADTEKEKLFKKKFPGETVYRYPWIKYIKAGSSKEEAEFWDNRSDRSFTWRNKNWVEIKSGISGLRMVYDGMRLAFGERPDLNTLISRCNTGWEKVEQAHKNGELYYNLLFSGNTCVSKLLIYKKTKLEHFSKKIFIARYTFRNDTRKQIDKAVKLVKNNSLIEGKVTEETNQDKGIPNILVTVKSSQSSAQAITEAGGWFSMLIQTETRDTNRGEALAIIEASGFKPYRKTWPLREQCNSWYNLNLSKKGDLVKVPELIGHKSTWAIEKLHSLQLIPISINGGVPATVEQAEIITWQKPSSGIMVGKGSKISFQAFDKMPINLFSINKDEKSEDNDAVTTSTADADVLDSYTKYNYGGIPGYVGGLMIAGKTEIISGEGTSYIACDGAGKPYPASGSFDWNSSVEDVLVLGHSGQTVSGMGFKAGTSTIVLHYDGMTKFFDVTVKVKVPNVSNMSYQQAIGTIEGLNLKASAANSIEKKQSLTVISQIPAPGTIVSANQVIKLELGEKKKGLFSVSGNEKVEDKNSFFSISESEKIEEEKSYSMNPPSNIKSQNQDILDENPEFDNSKENKSEQKFVLHQGHYFDSLNDNIQIWNFYRSIWTFNIEIQNISLQKIKEKRLYLLIKINNRPYRIYYFQKETVYVGNHRDHEGVVAQGMLPCATRGSNTIEISCPALPHIPKLIKRITDPPPSTKHLALWQKIISENSNNRLNQLKQQYDQIVQTYDHELIVHPRARNGFYKLSICANNFATTLVKTSECYCKLGKFNIALQLNAMTMPIFKKKLAISDKSGPYSNLTTLSYLINAYKRHANILLMGLNDRQSFLAFSTEALKYMILDYENSPSKYSKEAISDYAMRIAEQLLVIGENKSKAKPYYDIGLKYMNQDSLKNFIKPHEVIFNYNNCKEIFVNRTP